MTVVIQVTPEWKRREARQIQCHHLEPFALFFCLPYQGIGDPPRSRRLLSPILNQLLLTPQAGDCWTAYVIAEPCIVSKDAVSEEKPDSRSLDQIVQQLSVAAIRAATTKNLTIPNRFTLIENFLATVSAVHSTSGSADQSLHINPQGNCRCA